VSKIAYTPLAEEGRLLVVVPAASLQDGALHTRWSGRAAAILSDTTTSLRDVVRDLLANPQIRAVVFEGVCCSRPAYDLFWTDSQDPGWRIDKEHLALVRQFVDLFDDDCSWRTPPQPFWPMRIAYLEEMKDK
jgi:hypothetical protein